MGCGCKKKGNNVQPTNQTKGATIRLSESKPATQSNVPVNQQQQQQVDLILERINQLNSKLI